MNLSVETGASLSLGELLSVSAIAPSLTAAARLPCRCRATEKCATVTATDWAELWYRQHWAKSVEQTHSLSAVLWCSQREEKKGRGEKRAIALGSAGPITLRALPSTQQQKDQTGRWQKKEGKS